MWCALTSFVLVALPYALAQTAVTTITSTPASVPTPGQTCTGADSFCVGGPIILRCGAAGTLEPGNCDDNLNEPPLGALCVSYAPSAASCSAVQPVTSTTSAIAVPTPGQSCTGNTAFCAADTSPIILRCNNGTILPGNCDDNLGEPPLGALCISYAPSSASCSANGPTTSATGIGGGTGTSPGGPTVTSRNGTFSATAITPTGSSPPIVTGAADSTRSWTGAVMAGAAALLAGGAMVL